MPADYDGVGAPEQREDEERQHRADVEQANRMLRDDLAQMEARAEKAEAEQDELAAEIETLKDEREQILGMIQTRLQPDGSPPPGGPVVLVSWITNETWKRIADLERQLAEARKQSERLLNIARGCHDYGGGYSGTTNAKIYHHGIQTVINALEAAIKEDTLQTRVLESVGRDAARRTEAPDAR